MRNALSACGIEIEDTGPTSLVVHGGIEKLKTPEGDIFIGNSGTSVRFLAAFAALVPGQVTFVGDEHMAKRPIADLVDALQQMGVEVECPTGCPPITIKGGNRGLPGGHVRMRGTKSSQYFSALMLSGAFAQKPIQIQIEGTLVSLPYVTMTQQMVHDVTGGQMRIDVTDTNTITIDTLGTASSAELHYTIEPDASSASYPFATAAATGSTVRVPNLTSASIQGDYGFVKVLEKLGCTVAMGENHTTVTGPPAGQLGKEPLTVDMHHISDTVMTLAAIAPLCSAPVHIMNVANIRIKETDRLVRGCVLVRSRCVGVSGVEWYT
jgi:3-phosphoshikimate 1-carboxyvinyltransferase